MGKYKVKNIFITPTKYAIKYIANSEGLVMQGKYDEIFTQDCIDMLKDNNNIEIISFKACNHYLESSEDIDKTLEVLGEMVHIYSNYFKK